MKSIKVLPCWAAVIAAAHWVCLGVQGQQLTAMHQLHRRPPRNDSFFNDLNYNFWNDPHHHMHRQSIDSKSHTTLSRSLC